MGRGEGLPDGALRAGAITGTLLPRTGRGVVLLRRGRGKDERFFLLVGLSSSMLWKTHDPCVRYLEGTGSVLEQYLEGTPPQRWIV